MKSKIPILCTLLIVLFTTYVTAQVAKPRPGGNQKSEVCQWMGEVKVCVNYHSPDVSLPSGKSRRGEIWGKLVPYGLHPQPWLEKEGEAPQPKPWRAGADENTTLSISHDVTIAGKALKAGTYGLFFIVGEEEWELVLSNDHDKWGAYFYDPTNDALRVNVTPEKAEFREWLTYEFLIRKDDQVTLAMLWEDLRVPVDIAAPNVHDIYLDQYRKDLTSEKMMYWYNWQEAAQYCADNQVALEQGLEWAEKAIDQGWIGQANFTTLRTKAELLEALGKNKEAKKAMDLAIQYTGGLFDLHNYGRELLMDNKVDQALNIFNINAKKHPNHWVSQLGLARGYAASGDTKRALKYAKNAQKMIPNEEMGVRKYAVNLLIEQLNKNEKPVIFLATDWKQVY